MTTLTLSLAVVCALGTLGALAYVLLSGSLVRVEPHRLGGTDAPRNPVCRWSVDGSPT